MATLTVTGRSDVAGVASDVDNVAASVRGLGDDVARVDDVARTSGSGLDSLADASDNAASRSSQAAGGLGDLAGGLEAIGATGAGTALEGVALAAQTAVGAGDILNLVSETTAGRYILQTAATVGQTAASVAQTAATTALTGASAAFNAVMALNPVALVVIAVVALAAGMVLAYKNSETFREIVQGVFEAAKGYVMVYVDIIQTVIGLFRDIPGIARDAWNKVSGAIGDAADDAIGFITDLYDHVSDGVADVRDTVEAGFSAAFAPIQTAIGWVQDLIDKISSIDFPDLPFGLGRADTAGSKEDFLDPFNPNGINAGNLLAVPLALTVKAEEQDKDKAMRTLVESLRDYFARQGMTLAITEE